MSDNESNWILPGEEKLEFGLDYLVDDLIVTAAEKALGESTASQLPGRQNGGAADAYRHFLIAAELSRDYGEARAFNLLLEHEKETSGGADNGLDFWNNDIGLKIGSYVREKNGSWKDVVRLARSVIVSSFSKGQYDEIKHWKIRSADEGIRLAYKHSEKLNGKSGLNFEEFSSAFNRKLRFRAEEGTLSLDDGNLVVNRAAMTSPQHWAKHPKIIVGGKPVELSVLSSQFPTRQWFSGKGFVYEKGNNAPHLSFPVSSLRAGASIAATSHEFFSSTPLSRQEVELVPPAWRANDLGENKTTPTAFNNASEQEKLRAEENEQTSPSRNENQSVPVPSKKPEKRTSLEHRTRFAVNPFDLSKPKLEQQVAMLERNPLRARQMILAAGRDPVLFRL